MFHSLRMRLAMWYRNTLRDLLQSPIVDRPAYSTGWKDGYTVGQTAGWRQGYDACLNTIRRLNRDQLNSLKEQLDQPEQTV